MKWRFVLTLIVVLNLLKLLLELIFMINICKNKKRSCYFYSFFAFEEKEVWHNVCYDPLYIIIYFNIKGFMQSKFKELKLLSFLENPIFFILFVFLNKMFISNQIIKFQFWDIAKKVVKCICYLLFLLSTFHYCLCS